jgi:serine/arginine repetitive matrix protein 1
MMQINLTGFLGGSKARAFIGELWNLLASAQSSPDGIPAELVEMKKKELLKAKVYISDCFLFLFIFFILLGRK